MIVLNRVAFAGSPAAAVTVLESLVDAGIQVVRVVTHPDTRRGRGNTLSPTPVKSRAVELGIDVHEHVDFLLGDDRSAPDVDAVVVVAYGRIVPKTLLEPATGVPMVNVHFSLLPRWRGAAPVERAILAGDSVTGVCIMGMEEALDTGPVYAVAETTIANDDTTATLTNRLAHIGATTLIDVLHNWPVRATPQAGDATYAHKITAADLVIDWSLPADAIERKIRAVAAYSTTSNRRRLRVVSATADMTPTSDHIAGSYVGNSRIVCGSGSLIVHRVRPEGKSEMSFEAWANGARLSVGEKFGGAA